MEELNEKITKISNEANYRIPIDKIPPNSKIVIADEPYIIHTFDELIIIKVCKKIIKCITEWGAKKQYKKEELKKALDVNDYYVFKLDDVGAVDGKYYLDIYGNVAHMPRA